jgi:hypothetical protein
VSSPKLSGNKGKLLAFGAEDSNLQTFPGSVNIRRRIKSFSLTPSASNIDEGADLG